MKMNELRAHWARRALEQLMADTGCERAEAVADLLTNIKHLCEQNPEFQSFDAALSLSEVNYQAESKHESEMDASEFAVSEPAQQLRNDLPAPLSGLVMGLLDKAASELEGLDSEPGHVAQAADAVRSALAALSAAAPERTTLAAGNTSEQAIGCMVMTTSDGAVGLCPIVAFSDGAVQFRTASWQPVEPDGHTVEVTFQIDGSKNFTISGDVWRTLENGGAEEVFAALVRHDAVEAAGLVALLSKNPEAKFFERFVTRDVTESCPVVLPANGDRPAEEVDYALEARNFGLWQVDDDNLPEEYISDPSPDGAVEVSLSDYIGVLARRAAHVAEVRATVMATAGSPGI